MHEEMSAPAYFESYSNMAVHELMLKDRPRTLAYKNFIESNAKLFAGKIVLDVGAGTGILSLFAGSAGAKKVYAIEASAMATACRKIVKDNGLNDVIEVFESTVEDVCLPDGLRVDIIISEWMGFYLLHESMLDSVIFARDKWLGPSGIVLPSYAKLYLAPVNMDTYEEEHVNFWQNVYGYDFSSMLPSANEAQLKEPLITIVKSDQLLADAEIITEFDLQTVSIEEIQKIVKEISFSATSSRLLHGFVSWFDVEFLGEEASPHYLAANEPITPVSLSTGPGSESTHWKQTVFFLPSPQAIERTEEVTILIVLAQDPMNARRYNISIEMLEIQKVKTDKMSAQTGMMSDDEFEDDISCDEDEEEHHIPCDCDAPRCKIIKALVEKYDEDEQRMAIEGGEVIDVTTELEEFEDEDDDEMSNKVDEA